MIFFEESFEIELRNENGVIVATLVLSLLNADGFTKE